MKNIPVAALLPLTEFTHFPQVLEGVPFQQRDPAIKLYLSKNNIAWLPPKLFDITHLKVLSVRYNNLTWLPPGIGKLKNLQELNISSNHLQVLPAELLDLISDPATSQIQSLFLQPNFFYPSFTFDICPRRRAEARLAFRVELDRMQRRAKWIDMPSHLELKTFYTAIFWGRSAVTFRHNLEPDEHTPICLSPMTQDRQPSPNIPDSATRHATKVPSLLDIALRVCYNSDELPSLKHLLREPEHLVRLLELAETQKARGDQFCCKCKRLIITPKTVWIEWWAPLEYIPNYSFLEFAGTYEDVLPFVRYGCSWKCVPNDLIQPGALLSEELEVLRLEAIRQRERDRLAQEAQEAQKAREDQEAQEA